MSRWQLEPYSLQGDISARLISGAGRVLSPFGYRGYWQAAQLLGALADKGQRCVIQLGQGDCMSVHVRDQYWSRLLAPGFRYEPDIWRILAAIGFGPKSGFLDCGANYGYWSIIASGRNFSCPHVVAVEASAATFAELSRNRVLNGDRFVAIHRALFSESGRQLFLESSQDHHSAASFSLVPSRGGVLTSSVDDLVAEHFGLELDVLCVKLDVEGVEIEAFEGATETQSRNALFMYEDHGNDPTARVTRYVLEKGLAVYFVTDDLTIVPVPDLEAARRLKVRDMIGYNFFAAAPDAPVAATLGREVSKRRTANAIRS